MKLDLKRNIKQSKLFIITTVMGIFVSAVILLCCPMSSSADRLISTHDLPYKFLKNIPVKITKENINKYTHKLPTGRLISPVGLLSATENFPTNVKV
jgi:hypothetical protein